MVLAATSSDQVTLLTSTAADKKLDSLPEYKELLQTFITKEVSPGTLTWATLELWLSCKHCDVCISTHAAGTPSVWAVAPSCR